MIHIENNSLFLLLFSYFLLSLQLKAAKLIKTMKMKKNLIWMMAAILTPVAMLTSCTDNIDNAFPTRPAGETPVQTKFWEKFESWQTDSCSVGDDFFMHMTGKFWWNPTTIYPDGLIPYAASEMFGKTVTLTEDTGDPDLKTIQEVVNASTPEKEPTESEMNEMVNARLNEIWQGATTMEQAMEALGRATALGYNNYLEPVVKIVDGKPTFALDTPMPRYYDASNLGPLYSKVQLQERQAYRGGQPVRRAAGEMDANKAAFIKGMNLGVAAEEVVWEKSANENYAELMKAMLAPDSVKKFITQMITLYDGLLISDEVLEEYANIQYPSITGKTVKLPLPRYKLNNFIRTYMGQIYRVRAFNKKYVTADMKKQYAGWCEDFRQAFQKRLEKNQWLSETTRANALDKLKHMEFYVAAEPDVIPDVAAPTVKKGDLISLVRQMRDRRINTYRWMIGRSRREVLMLISYCQDLYDYLEDNASYSLSTNDVTINPSNLLPPYVDAKDEEPLTLVSLGSSIGHELTHGFDSEGRTYDKYGAKKDWWTPADTAKFVQFANQLVENYNQLLMMPWASKTLYCNGKGTLAENIADIGGCCLGLDLLLARHPDANPERIKQLTKRYFQAWAIEWSRTYDLDFAETAYYGDSHSQSRERVNGVVRNINAWYNAYDITKGTLYLEPSKRVAIW